MADEGQSDRVQRLRWEYAFKMLGIDPHSLVFVDETGCNLAMAILTAWAMIGVRAVDHRPKRPGENISVLAGLSLQGIQAAQTVQGTVNGLVFLNWVKYTLAPTLKPGQVVLMDNNKIHKGEEVRKAIEATGARLEFLSPYSPDFNPIENAWSKLKHILKKLGARTVEAFWRAIEKAVRMVSEWDAWDWFAHCGYTR